ncbi:Non-specific serine/threonine protein kinase [Bertholletia excelsa]
MDFWPLRSSLFAIFFLSVPALVRAQQPYIGLAFNDCNKADNSTSVLGYSCNGLNKTCQAYLTFRSQSPYNNVSSISELLGADPTQLSQLNSVAEDSTFEANKMVLVPVTCSCSGNYSQSNTSFLVSSVAGTYLWIANNTYQGLSTCQALQAQNSNYSATELPIGARIRVPLRCACPTKDQSDAGINYLLSYLVTWGEYVSLISSMFGVSTQTVLEANELTEQNPTINPFTTLLVPLQDPPTVSQTISPPPPPASPPPPSSQPSSNGKSNKTWVYVVVGVLGGGGLLLVAGIIVFYFFFHKREKEANPVIASKSFEAIEKPYGKKLEEESASIDFLESLSDIAQSLKVYSYEELRNATENFGPSHLIEGSVYRGTINGDFAAIKKVNGDVSKEIHVLSKVSHFNLIRLSGVCFNKGYWYLVYEYAVNGSLSDWIFHKDNKFLNWTQRIQISLDVATGLNYIHNYTSPPFVHKDVKSSNVLLDGDFRAKIANFGLARSADGQEGEFALTRHIVGTKGYMAPEYLENGFVSTNMDVYAFGVLMLEILTGKEVALLSKGHVQLSEVLAPMLLEENEKNSSDDFIDPSLQGNYPVELAILVGRLIDRCIKENPSDRPGMDEVVQSLSRIMSTSLNWELSKSNSGYQSFS